MTMRGNAEDELIENFRNGKTSAFNEIFYKYHFTVCYLANSIIRDKDHEIAKDIALNGFIRLWHRRRKIINLLDVQKFLYYEARDNSIRRLRTAYAQGQIYLSNGNTKEYLLTNEQRWLIRLTDEKDLQDFARDRIFDALTNATIYNTVKQFPVELQDTIQQVWRRVPVMGSSLQTGETTAHVKLVRKRTMTEFKGALLRTPLFREVLGTDDISSLDYPPGQSE